LQVEGLVCTVDNLRLLPWAVRHPRAPSFVSSPPAASGLPPTPHHLHRPHVRPPAWGAAPRPATTAWRSCTRSVVSGGTLHHTTSYYIKLHQTTSNYRDTYCCASSIWGSSIPLSVPSSDHLFEALGTFLGPPFWGTRYLPRTTFLRHSVAVLPKGGPRKVPPVVSRSLIYCSHNTY